MKTRFSSYLQNVNNLYYCLVIKRRQALGIRVFEWFLTRSSSNDLIAGLFLCTDAGGGWSSLAVRKGFGVGLRKRQIGFRELSMKTVKKSRSVCPFSSAVRSLEKRDSN
ncbi:hypothetical protein NPIL_197041 [Nephila pilipes]|uniref:Uncharacterized protein n=1 Tax=Nephila pilipes TaxID=299642 RepID=A0A8X6PL51_NEPPI|nr:hypothetical protein NPIL_197041 [Nephila pilipes]